MSLRSTIKFMTGVVLLGCGGDTTTSIDDPMVHQHNGTEDGNAISENQRDPTSVADAALTCTYLSPFSRVMECLEYLGDDWTEPVARMECDQRTDAVFALGVCNDNESLGACHVDMGLPTEARTVVLETDDSQCALTALGCQQFAGGTFIPSDICADVSVPEPESTEPMSSPEVFIPPIFICTPSVDETPGMSADEEVCTWQSIGGCTEPGRRYSDYAECDTVMTQRPFFPVPPSNFKTAEDDPVLADEMFLAEVDWARQQAESCGCVCCHTTGVSPRGPAAFDTAAEGIWTDSFTSRGLAIAAGWIDSSPLGAHAAMTNNGFDRSRTGLPTTDPDRMIRFFEGELARRGVTRERFEGSPAIGGPLATQVAFEPEPCDDAIGLDSAGRLHWSGGPARYVFVLDSGSENPGVPPNLDEPSGTLWKLDVDHRSAPLNSGIRYGEVPPGTTQAVPDTGSAYALNPDDEYYLYVLKDVGAPIERCLFVAPDVVTNQTDEGVDDPWGAVCREDSDCESPTNNCVKMPGAPSGYCSIHCASNAECTGTGTPAGWTCNAVNCAIADLTWCGPGEEIEESGGFLSVCD